MRVCSVRDNFSAPYLTEYLLLAYGLLRTAATRGKQLNTCYSNTRARTIFSRARFVVNGIRLLGDPLSGSGHDIETL